MLSKLHSPRITRQHESIALVIVTVLNAILNRIAVLEHGQPHCAQSHLERQIRIVSQQRVKQKSRQSVHRHRLWMYGHAQTTTRTAVQHLRRQLLQHLDEQAIEVDVPQSGDQLVLLLADDVLRVQALRHYALFAQRQDGGLWLEQV